MGKTKNHWNCCQLLITWEVIFYSKEWAMTLLLCKELVICLKPFQEPLVHNVLTEAWLCPSPNTSSYTPSVQTASWSAFNPVIHSAICALYLCNLKGKREEGKEMFFPDVGDNSHFSNGWSIKDFWRQSSGLRKKKKTTNQTLEKFIQTIHCDK